jgi:hypothetical protein
MREAVAVAAEGDALLNLLLYSAPAVAVVHHTGDVVVLVSNMVKL